MRKHLLEYSPVLTYGELAEALRRDFPDLAAHQRSAKFHAALAEISRACRAERAIRGPVVGRKNHDSSKSRRGTQVAATLYSILETTKLHAIDAAAYLIAAAIAGERGETLLPWDFAART